MKRKTFSHYLKQSMILAFCFFFLALFLLPVVTEAAPVGKITKLEGRVDVLKAGQNAVAGVSLGDNVDVGDIYRAKTNSRAEITFFNRNILRIHPATRVQVSQYSDDGTRSNQVMKMDRGKVEAISSKDFVRKVSSFAEGNKFEVHTPNAVAGIRGSGMTVGFAQMVTGLFFSTGSGYFYNPNQPAIIQNVSAGFVSFIAGTGGMPSRPVPGNVSYVGGSGGPAPGTGTGAGGASNLTVQTAMVDPINQIYTFTPPPTIPNVFVGSVPYMSGGFGNADIGMNLSVNNVKFYGPSMTGQPTTWQADSVSGNFWNLHGLANSFAFTVCGGGMSSYVQVTGSDTDFSGTWTATVANGNASTGVGDYKQPFTFSGTASGTWSANWVSTGTLSGISSGVVPSVLTQDPVVTQTIQVGIVNGPVKYTDAFDTINLSGIKFWGTATGAVPYAWTASVSGTRTSSSTVYSLSGGAPATTATFALNSAGGGSFTAYVFNGNVPAGGMGASPNYQGQVTFNGRAAGTYSGSTLSGTASGKAAAAGPSGF